MNPSLWIRNKLLQLGYSIPSNLPHKCTFCDSGKGPYIEPDRPVDRSIGEHIFKLPGIGYYGPTKEHGSHLDQVLCKTPQEAIALYEKYWRGSNGTICWKEVSLDLAFWEEGWGTLSLPDFSSSVFSSRKVVERMVAAGLSFSIWTAPSVSSVSWGWTAAFKNSVYPPEYKDLLAPTPGVWAHRDESEDMAICVAALKACEGMDNNFKQILELCSKNLPGPYEE